MRSALVPPFLHGGERMSTKIADLKAAIQQFLDEHTYLWVVIDGQVHEVEMEWCDAIHISQAEDDTNIRLSVYIDINQEHQIIPIDEFYDRRVEAEYAVWGLAKNLTATLKEIGS
jgi:hypothetical protein